MCRCLTRRTSNVSPCRRSPTSSRRPKKSRIAERGGRLPIEILMPALSPTMTEGNLAKWLKKEGDSVKAGDVIAEVETDKATMEVEAVDEGKLGKILVPEGSQGVKVNEPIALLLEEGEDSAALAKGGAAKKAPPAGEAPKTEPAPAPKATAPAPAPAPKGNGHDQGERVFASPLAKRMA